MPNPEFQFNFEYNLHKSNIPIGIADDDYNRLSVVYGVDIEELLAEVNSNEESNAREAALILKEHPTAPYELSGKRICFLGDSISSDRRGFCEILRTAFKDHRDIHIVNYSISAYKVIDIITNFVPSVTDFAPDIAHLLIGSNDMKRTSDEFGMQLFSPNEFQKDLRYLISTLTGRGTTLIVSTIPPFDAEKVRRQYWDVNTRYVESDREAFNAIVREEAARPGCMLNEMDAVYAQYGTDEITNEDGLHLNLLGQRLMAINVLDKLIKAAQPRPR